MAITWGSMDNHLRVGINITQSPSSVTSDTDSVKLTVKYYVGNDSVGWDFNDPQTMTYTGAITGSTSFQNTLSAVNDSQLVATKTLTVNLTGSTQSKSFTGKISGAYNGATPTHTRSWTVPARPSPPAVVPSAPPAPTFATIEWTGATTFPIIPPDAGTASIDRYQVQVATSTAFTTIVFDKTYAGVDADNAENYGVTTSGSNPSTLYYLRIRAHNSVGWGSYSSASGSPFTTTAKPDGNFYYVKGDDDEWHLAPTDYRKNDSTAWDEIASGIKTGPSTWDMS
jgi:hypothetical protein